MTNAGFTDISQYRDIESLNYYNLMKRKGKPEEEIYESLRRKSRDNSRTPMQWDDSENAGFSDVQPWISVIPNYKEINTLDRESDNSIFNYYRKLIRLRKAVPVIADGIFEALLEDDDQILAYKRTDSTQELYVFCNYFPEETQVSLNIPADCRCILSNYNEDIRPENLTLRPYEAVMFLRDI